MNRQVERLAAAGPYPAPVAGSPWLGAAWAGWINRSLATRLIVLMLALLLVLQVASFGAIRASLKSHARDVLPEQLAKADSVLANVLNQRAASLTEGAKILASDWALRDAYRDRDEQHGRQTLDDALANHGARLKANAIALLDLDFKLAAYSGDAGDSLAQMLPSLGATLKAAQRTNKAASHLVLVGGQLHQLVLAPMMTGTVLRAWVLMGVPLDSAQIANMRELSTDHFTLLVRPEPGAPWQAMLTSLPAVQAQALAARTWSAAEASGATMQEIEAADDMLAVRTRWLSAPAVPGQEPGGDPAGSAEVLALVSASIDDAVRLSRDLQLALLLITAIGFAAFGVGSAYTARRVTDPLRDLTCAAERLGAGDFSSPMRRLRRSDEIGSLANAFERMRINVADKQAQVERLAYWDSLTGLPNRVQFAHAVGLALEAATAQGHQVAVVMLDLDRFKHVNDLLGYRLGDMLLTLLAKRLQHQVVRGDDLVARLSGDEFAVLLRRGDAALAHAVAARIVQAFEAPLALEEHRVDMGAGIGMACWPDHAADVETLLSRAEVAMYCAKRRAAGPLMYEASIDAASAQTLSLLGELRHAVEHGELRLFLQPKLGLANACVVGAETLVRWLHPLRGMVPPMDFIPFAEQTGYIRQLTLWIFEEAARHSNALRAEGHALTLSVNLSTRDLLDPDLPQKFGAVLVRHQVAATAFCLEITESAIMDDPQRALLTLERLSAQGFGLSIDDFGTGYSSLAYLKRLPVDELKIDKSFVMAMETDLDDLKIVRSTIDLAHNLGLRVVAEGVENARVWDLLQELECDQAQGYHMGRPMPANEFAAWVDAWQARQCKPPSARPDSSTLLH